MWFLHRRRKIESPSRSRNYARYIYIVAASRCIRNYLIQCYIPAFIYVHPQERTYSICFSFFFFNFLFSAIENNSQVKFDENTSLVSKNYFHFLNFVNYFWVWIYHSQTDEPLSKVAKSQWPFFAVAHFLYESKVE